MPTPLAPPLPNNLDAERSVLGAVLLDNDALKKLVPDLADDFFRPSSSRSSPHSTIYSAMLRLAGQAKPIDLVVLTEELHRMGELDQCGGAAYLSALADGMPKVMNVEHYAAIVREKALLRTLIHMTGAIQGRAFDGDLAGAREALARILYHPAYRNTRETNSFPFVTGAELGADTAQQTDWILPGYLAAGALTELSGQVKRAGKTEFALRLCRAVIDGADFIGERCGRTSVVYLSEQPPTSFRQAAQRAGLLSSGEFNVLFWKDVAQLRWDVVVEAAVERCVKADARLLVVDTLGQFAGLVGDSENNAGDALAAIKPMQLAAGQGLGALVVRHDRKSGGDIGESARGSSAISGAADILLTLRRAPNGSERSRILQGLSRFNETPVEPRIIELQEHGSYTLLGSRAEVAVRQAADQILKVAPTNANDAAELKHVLAGLDLPRATAYRAVETLVRDGLLVRTGRGRRGDAFRYHQADTVSIGLNRNPTVGLRLKESDA